MAKAIKKSIVKTTAPAVTKFLKKGGKCAGCGAKMKKK